MTYRRFKCTVCGKQSGKYCAEHEWPTVCQKCEDKAKSKTKRAVLDKLKKKSIETRLALIEEELYNLRESEPVDLNPRF